MHTTLLFFHISHTVTLSEVREIRKMV